MIRVAVEDREDVVGEQRQRHPAEGRGARAADAEHRQVPADLDLAVSGRDADSDADQRHREQRLRGQQRAGGVEIGIERHHQQRRKQPADQQADEQAEDRPAHVPGRVGKAGRGPAGCRSPRRCAAALARQAARPPQVMLARGASRRVRRSRAGGGMAPERLGRLAEDLGRRGGPVRRRGRDCPSGQYSAVARLARERSASSCSRTTIVFAARSPSRWRRGDPRTIR